jgi:hypothetical protein
MSDFTTELLQETVTSQTWVKKTIDLSAYASGHIYIAFRHYNSYAMWTLYIDEVGIEQKWGIPTFNVYRDGELVGETAQKTFIDNNVVEGAVYTYCVIPQYSTCQVEPACVDEVEIPKCIPTDVRDVVATGNQTDKKAIVTWEYNATGASFDVYRNEVFVTNVTVKNFTEDIDYDIIYRYCIVPINTTCPGGASACDTTIINTVVGIGETVMGINIFPNPASTIVNVTGENISRIDIYNAIGQLVMSIKDNNPGKVDVSSFEPGSYLFKVYTTGDVIITKPIVITNNR